MPSRLGRGTLARFVLVRLAATVVLLLALSFVVFTLLYLAPGDPARNLLGPRNPSPELLESIRAEYHLDDPFITQYVLWLGDVVRGDLGQSIRSDTAVTSLLADRVLLTLELAMMAFVITLLVAVPMGVRAAWRSGSAFDRTASIASIVGVGAPSYAIGLVLLYLFGVRFSVFPVYGIGEGWIDQLWHLTLPAITLAIGISALVFKLTRTAVLGELEQDYVAFARSRGLTEGAVRRIVLRNAVIPIITSSGLVFAFLFGGTILVEVTFALPGIGGLLASSVTFKDIPVVQAITLLTALVIALTALAVDILTYTIDPRVRARGLA